MSWTDLVTNEILLDICNKQKVNWEWGKGEKVKRANLDNIFLFSLACVFSCAVPNNGWQFC